MSKQALMCDLETRTKENDASVWAWGCCTIDDNYSFVWGKNLDSFFDFIFRGYYKLYFHNLKFDAEALMCWLFKHGYEYYDGDKKEAPNKSFHIMMNGNGLFFSMWIKKGKNIIDIIDSYKLIHLPVAKIGPAFNLGESKGKIDYEKERELDYSPTKEEIEYLKNDVVIVAKALKIFLDNGMKKNTQASNALADFKSRIGDKKFERLFGEVPIAQYDDIKQSYKGGWCYLNPLYKNVVVGKGRVYDKNSMYPWVMKTKLLPYGEPVYYEGEYAQDDMFPLYIQIVTFQFEIKKDHLPTIQLKHPGPWKPTDYLTSSDGEDVTMCVTNVDWELIKKHYHIYNVQYHKGYKFRGMRKVFDEYIDYWYKVKEDASKEGNAGMRQLAKLMLNALYGKFGTSPYIREKTPEYIEGKIKYKTGPMIIKNGIYIPVAAFITAYAREEVINSAQANYDNFVYSDTDSIHLIGDNEPNLDIDDYRLGAWKQESKFTQAKFLRQKTYVEEIDGKLEIKCAGMPETLKDKVNLDNFTFGATFYGKLMPKHGVDGCVLVPTTFEIKP